MLIHVAGDHLTRDEIGIEATNWQGATPLWFYILREADARAGGHHLGPVGARTVGDPLTGLLDRDPRPYRRADPAWPPAYPPMATLLDFGATG